MINSRKVCSLVTLTWREYKGLKSAIQHHIYSNLFWNSLSCRRCKNIDVSFLTSARNTSSPEAKARQLERRVVWLAHLHQAAWSRQNEVCGCRRKDRCRETDKKVHRAPKNKSLRLEPVQETSYTSACACTDWKINITLGPAVLRASSAIISN